MPDPGVFSRESILPRVFLICHISCHIYLNDGMPARYSFPEIAGTSRALEDVIMGSRKVQAGEYG